MENNKQNVYHRNDELSNRLFLSYQNISSKMSTIKAMNYQASYILMENNKQNVYHRSNELSNRLLSSYQNINSKMSTIKAMNYQTDFLRLNGK